MEPKTISVPGFARRPPPADQAAARRRRFLLIAVGLSIAFHLATMLLIVVLPRVLPRDTAPQEPGTVELLMVEQKGTTPSQAGAPDSQPAPPEKPTETAKQEPQPPAPPPPQAAAPAPAPTPDAEEPAPSPVAPTPPARAEIKPAPQPAAPANPKPAAEPQPTGPVFDLAGTESESNAYVLGAQVIPASPDDRFRNRPPVFPREAELRGEHGTVVVVIHVSEAGIATGADIMESSGVEALDRAAVDAVRKWHFRPALREGRSVPFDMPFRFIFQAD